MPYADPEKAKAVKRAYYNRRYRKSRAFQKAEKARKAVWYEENREHVIARTLAWRAENAA